jgi:hypothetical protein
MSQQHSFDLGDRRVEPKKNGASEQARREILEQSRAIETTVESNVSSPMRETARPANTSDPRVPQSQEVVAAVFGPIGELRGATAGENRKRGRLEFF